MKSLKSGKGISTMRKPFVRIENTTAGITLIALVITIIVLLILAGVSISLVVGENGVLNQATQAVEANRKSEEKEQISLAYAALQTQKLAGKKANIDASDLANQINNMAGAGTVEVTKNDSKGTYTIVYKESKTEYTINANGNFIGEENPDESSGIVQPTNVDDWLYTVDEATGVATITGYKGTTDTEIIVPNYIGDVPVKSIIGRRTNVSSDYGEYSLGIWEPSICETILGTCGMSEGKWQRTITKVTISNEIENIGNYAFANGNALQEVIIPSSVTSIGDDAFAVCLNLTTVNYTGTQEQWDNITKGTGNDYLLNATINCNYGN